MRLKKLTRASLVSLVVIGVMLCGITFSYAIAPTKLQWEAPTTNEDGTELTDLAGYKVYCGKSKDNLKHVKDVKNVTEVLLTELNPACKYFTVTAYNKSGIESKRTDTCSLIAPSPPVDGCRLIR